MENEYKYLYAIIRKPQEGKTFICLENIKQNDNIIHFVITMNTIKANKQFFDRAYEMFGEKLMVLNSEKNNETYQANEILKVWKGFKDNKNIVIMCAHKVRFTRSITGLLELLESTTNMNKKIIIHIDEAHKYIPSFRDEVYSMNEKDIVERIYCLSATPFNVWDPDNYKIYQKIYVVDVSEQFKIEDSTKYFGVKDVELLSLPGDNKYELIAKYDISIPQFIIDRWEPKLNDYEKKKVWYSKKKTYFLLGREYEYLCFIKCSLFYLISKEFLNNSYFSYNFLPGYIRRVTHYGIMDLVLTCLDNALVIVFNGLVCQGFIKKGIEILEIELVNHNEPSVQIENIVRRYPNRPTFITGHICIGMSVTLINQNLGNFDNVILSFPQYHEQPDILYQMCRFLFNYINWEPKNQQKIKKTRFLTRDTIDYEICLAYEKQIDYINKNLKGSLRTQGEVKGDIKVKERKKPKERTNDSIQQYVKINNAKQFKVYDDNDTDIWEEVKIFWLNFRGKELNDKSKSMLTMDGDYYKCSTTGSSKKQELQSIKKFIKGLKWNSNYQLAKNNYKYSRLYVGYDDISCSNEYTIFVRILELENNDTVNRHLNSLK